jgi:TfoX/Sxy family transcriptional regulator of competence genes
MRTTDETIAEILEQIAGAGGTRSIKMMGEYVLYCDEKVVALVCKNELVVKDTEQGRTFAPDLELISAYPGSKPGLHVPANRRADTKWLAKLIRITANALSAKKK